MCPASGARLPVIRLKAVVLPAPLPPIRLVMVPAFTSNDRSSTACRPPKDFDNVSSLRIVSFPTAILLLHPLPLFAPPPPPGMAVQAREQPGAQQRTQLPRHHHL